MRKLLIGWLLLPVVARASIVDTYETGYCNYRCEAYDQQQETSAAAFYMNHHARDKAELVEYDFDKSPSLAVPAEMPVGAVDIQTAAPLHAARWDCAGHGAAYLFTGH